MLQPDFDQQPDIPGVFPRNPHHESSADFPTSTGRSAQVGVIEYHEAEHAPGALVEAVEQPSQPGAQRRRRPSPTMWRLTLLLGDSALLVTSLLVGFMLRLQLELNVAGHELGSLLSFTLSMLALAAPALMAWRIVLARVMGLPRFRQQAVIVGANPAGASIAAELGKAKRPTADVLGYISESAAEHAQKEDAWPVLGGTKTLRSLARRGIVDMIIMAIDYKENPELFQEAIAAAQLGISVVPMARVYENTCGKIPVEHIGDQWFVTLPAERVTPPLYLCWRKALDLIFGLSGMLALIILFPIVALAIYMDSPGPIFYRQERLGYRGQPFQVLKFRSMRLDAERPGQAVWAKKHDQRVTRIGRLLRATHLDELPQMLNILRGEMTLIGPRPERQVFVNQLEKTIPFYRCRLSVKPGLTGWAQVKYPYTNTGHESLIKLQYDLYYIKHQSLTLDLLIMLKTVVEVLLCHGR